MLILFSLDDVILVITFNLYCLDVLHHGLMQLLLGQSHAYHG